MGIIINSEFVAAHLSASEIAEALERRLVLDAAERQAAETAAAQAEAEAKVAAERARQAQELAAAQAADMQQRAGTLATLTDAIKAITWTPAPAYPTNRAGVPAAIHSKAVRLFLEQSKARA